MLVAPFYTKLHPPCWCINLAQTCDFQTSKEAEEVAEEDEGRGDFKVYAFLHSSSSSSSQELFLLKTCILLKLKTSSDLNLQAPFLCYKNSKICVAALT